MTAPTVIHSELPYSKAESWKMFNAISRRYDFLNRFLSFGLDIFWRLKLAKFLPPNTSLKVLDLATGTGDALLNLFPAGKNIDTAIGIDMADQMLEIGRQKIKKANLESRISLQRGNVNQIPFSSDSFDVTTIAFGIRNVSDPQHSLHEMYRILKVGGRALILEFSIPANSVIRFFYLIYLRRIMPIVGAIVSGNLKAYRYLNATVETFVSGEEFCQMMRQAGFTNVTAHLLTFGIATIYQGDKV